MRQGRTNSIVDKKPDTAPLIGLGNALQNDIE